MPPQSPGWTVEYYSDARGRSPVNEDINDLQKSDRATVARYLLWLEEFGIDIDSSYAKRLSGDIWELTPGAIRVLYFLHTDRRFVVLHAFRKKSQRTQRRDIAIAEQRMLEFLERVG